MCISLSFSLVVVIVVVVFFFISTALRLLHTVSMYRAEQTSTSALEASQSNLFAAGHASVLLLLAVLIAVLVVAVGYRGVIAGTVTAAGATIVVDILLVGGTLEQGTLDRGLCGVGHGRDGRGNGRRD